MQKLEITGLGSISSSAPHLNDLRQVVTISKLIGVTNSLETSGKSFCVSKAKQSGHILSATATTEYHGFDCSKKKHKM